MKLFSLASSQFLSVMANALVLRSNSKVFAQLLELQNSITSSSSIDADFITSQKIIKIVNYYDRFFLKQNEEFYTLVHYFHLHADVDVMHAMKKVKALVEQLIGGQVLEQALKHYQEKMKVVCGLQGKVTFERVMQVIYKNQTGFLFRFYEEQNKRRHSLAFPASAQVSDVTFSVSLGEGRRVLTDAVRFGKLRHIVAFISINAIVYFI